MRGRDSVTGGGPDAGSNEYLTFAIDSQSYGLDILSVREIRAWTEVTNLPNTPDFVRGIINLRGAVVPIYDLRVRLGGGRTAPSRMHVVIVGSEEHTSELPSLMRISSAVFCLKTKNTTT